jgi:hypothetical protein
MPSTRLKFSDYLNSFSIEDLRTLAARRGARLTSIALSGRQTLVKSLSQLLERYEGVYAAIASLNVAELGALLWLLDGKGARGQTALAREAGVDPAVARGVLESLRLWGLIFPEGDWEHVVIPDQTRMARNYQIGAGARSQPKLDLVPPAMPAARGATDPRPGSFGLDLAEFLARVARSRFKLTQAGRINRRDLKAMEAGFGVPTPGYASFVSVLLVESGALGRTEEGILTVIEEIDSLLAQPPVSRGRLLLGGWTMMRGYPESSYGDPADEEYIPQTVVVQRTRITEILSGLPLDQTVTVKALAASLQWHAPLTFTQWGRTQGVELTAARLVRSLYWLGIAAVDDPQEPKLARLTPLGLRAMPWADPAAPGPEVTPDEAQFILQPNAEIFAPPNLSPRTFFHLRRITGEKKGAPQGVYPLTQESVRRALDTGSTVEEIVNFLERFSRTGLPGNVRALVETTGRQHGRIRLVPAQWVLVTDEPQLLNELRAVKPVATLLGQELTDRAAQVETARVNELMKTLRARGYAPLNQAEITGGPPLAAEVEIEVPSVGIAAGPGGVELGPDMAGMSDADDLPATDPDEIYELLLYACENDLELEIEYRGETRLVWPLTVEDPWLFAREPTARSRKGFLLDDILMARFTGALAGA